MPNELLVTVFGPQYSGGGLVLVGLALFRVVKVQSTQLQSTIAGLDRPNITMRINLVVLLLNIILGYILLLEYATLGVVIATIISEIVRYIALTYTVKQYLPEISIFSQPLRHQLLAGTLMFVLIDRLHATIGVSWWGELLVLISFGGIVYFAILTTNSRMFRVTIKGVLSDAFVN